jgi:hypothetical protein
MLTLNAKVDKLTPLKYFNPDFSIEKSALCAASGGVNPAEGGLKANFAVAKFGFNIDNAGFLNSSLPAKPRH